LFDSAVQRQPRLQSTTSDQFPTIYSQDVLWTPKGSPVIPKIGAIAILSCLRNENRRPGTGILSGCGIMEGVGILSKAFYFTAMSLLLFMAAQVVACDILHSDNCYISSQSQSPDRHSGDASGDNCLCCCQHVAVTQPLVFEPRETIVAALSKEMIQQPLVAPSRIDHPPRLS
jgi:hypothetical protein